MFNQLAALPVQLFVTSNLNDASEFKANTGNSTGKTQNLKSGSISCFPEKHTIKVFCEKEPEAKI